ASYRKYALGPDRRPATPHGPRALEDRAAWPPRIADLTRAIGHRFVAGRQRRQRGQDRRESVEESHVNANGPRPAVSAIPLARLPIEELQRLGLLRPQRRVCAHRSPATRRPGPCGERESPRRACPAAP